MSSLDISSLPAPKGEYSLYLHVPFCTKKCPYCHFFVIPNRSEYVPPFIKALRREWELRTYGWKQSPKTIYFGGGTPSLLPAEALEEILSWVSPAPGTEITIEANPESLTKEQAHAFAHLGINRVSLGVQSLNNQELLQLGRSHQKSDVQSAIDSLRDASISNISIDLMFDIPGQTLDSLEKSLDEALSLPIEHLSLYNLTIEPHTSFHKRRKQLLPLCPSEEESASMLELAIDRIESAGFDRYEISAFAKRGALSNHNLGYWQSRPFLGIGPSAFSDWEGCRFQVIPRFHPYCRAPTVHFHEKLAQKAAFAERLAIHLRILEGVHLSSFQREWGLLPEEISETIDRLIEESLLEKTDQKLKLSKRGTFFYDLVASALVSLNETGM